jgi:hypothetical protein
MFEKMLNYTRDLHNIIFGIENKNTLKNILRELYVNHRNSKYDSYVKQQYSFKINEMCDYVYRKCNATKTRIYETWLKVVFEGGMEITPFDSEIIKYLKEFIFGDVQMYQIIFEHKDTKTEKGRYYYVIKMKFENNKEKVKMFVSIQDLTNNHYTYLEKGLSMISNSSISEDGFIEFDVSNETLLDLAKYAYYEFNNCGFTGGFELYPQVSLVNNNQTLEYVNDYIATSQFNKKFLDLLIPF